MLRWQRATNTRTRCPRPKVRLASDIGVNSLPWLRGGVRIVRIFVYDVEHRASVWDMFVSWTNLPSDSPLRKSGVNVLLPGPRTVNLLPVPTWPWPFLMSLKVKQKLFWSLYCDLNMCSRAGTIPDMTFWPYLYIVCEPWCIAPNASRQRSLTFDLWPEVLWHYFFFSFPVCAEGFL